jgi:3-methyladenine DNA glycosylase AlkD
VTTPAAARAYFRQRFRKVGTPSRAKHDQAYLKSDLRFYGATVPDIRRAGTDFAREHRELTRSELRAIVTDLYATDWHELRSVSIAVLGKYPELLRETDLPWLVGLVRRSDTWAHVDWLAADIIGGVIERHQAGLRRLPGWAADKSFWVRRTALLAQLRPLSHGAGDFALFARLAAGMVEDKEFFIRKAIGWVLRAVSRERPELVHAFLRDHGARASGLTVREASQYLLTPMRAELRR